MGYELTATRLAACLCAAVYFGAWLVYRREERRLNRGRLIPDETNRRMTWLSGVMWLTAAGMGVLVAVYVVIPAVMEWSPGDTSLWRFVTWWIRRV